MAPIRRGRSRHATRQSGAPPLEGAEQVPPIESRPPPSVQAAPTERPLHAAASRAEGSGTRAQASGPFPVGPFPQAPVTAPPSPTVPRSHAAPADFPLQASTSGRGGTRTRPQTSVPEPRAAKQTPGMGPSARRSTVQSSPVDLPAQGCVRSVGGGGGTGAQARPAPPTVARHVPAIEKSRRRPRFRWSPTRSGCSPHRARGPRTRRSARGTARRAAASPKLPRRRWR